MKVAIIFGTRPEVIKLVPVIYALGKNKEIQVETCFTGQHKELVQDILKGFEIIPDFKLALLKDGQSLPEFVTTSVTNIFDYLEDSKPDFVLVQGDTNTVLSASLSAFYLKIPVGHVEAGLRTWNKNAPWPEETNRVLTTHLATLHFAPTLKNKSNLLKENIPEKNIYVTGNTVIDALHSALDKIKLDPGLIKDVPEKIIDVVKKKRRIVLITGHRRESFGAGFQNICQAILALAEKYSDYYFVYPVHLNPNVQKPVYELLSELPNVFLLKPLNYFAFIYLMRNSWLILTDSGGVQEEAPSLGKPVLVMRETTERPEAIDAGGVRLIGTIKEHIIQSVSAIADNNDQYRRMAQKRYPYGDGTAAKIIADHIYHFLKMEFNQYKNS